MWKTLKRLKWLAILMIIIAAVAVVWGNIQAAKKKPRFQTEKLEHGTVISTVNTTGTVNAVITVDIGCQVSGKITKLYVDFNSPVKKGQLLAQLDPLVYKSQVDEANANLESARATNANYQAQYQNALSKVRESQASVKNFSAQVEVSRANLAGARNNQKSAKANLDKALAQLENDRAEFKRAQELMKKDFISRSEMDAAETKYKVSLASVDVARAGLEEAASSVRSSQMQLDAATANSESSKIAAESQKALARAILAQVSQSMAQIKTMTSRLQGAMVNLGYTDIISPIDGVVVARSVDVGQTVAASFQAPKLFTLAKDLRDMEVYANVDEADIGRVETGMKVTFTVDAFQGHDFEGVVRQVRKSSVIDQGVVKYQVVISAKNPDLKLMPGMTANVIIISETRDDVLKVPNAAIRFRADSVDNFPYPPDAEKAPNVKNGKNGKNGSSPGETGKIRSKTGETTRFNTVWVFEGEGKVRQERILTGITDGQYTEMKKGSLTEGQDVIVGLQGNKAKSNVRAGSPGGPGGMRMFH